MTGASRHVPAPASLNTIAERVEVRLRRLLDDEIDRWSAVDLDLAEPLQSLAGLVLGSGKRLRPAFCHWGWVGAGGDPDDPMVADVGAAFELLHAFALVHDDVMDGSDTRRGVRTAHLEYAARHTVDGWRGEARRFGEGVAILVGDLAFVYADILVTGLPPTALEVWNELRVELNVGQYLDVLGTARGDTDRAGARRIATYKSGKYTVERPLHVGAALAGRFDDLVGAYSAYGLPLGEAFQLRDDVLGAFGDSSVTGKPVGDDLREGKPTPLLAIAVERATEDVRPLLKRVGAPDLDAGEIAARQDVLRETGALDEVERTIDELAEIAVASLATAPIGDEARQELTELAWYVARRER
jgi:geranylgeranyl diphosphate synthase type I